MNVFKIAAVTTLIMLSSAFANAEIIFHEGEQSFLDALTPEQESELILTSAVLFQHPSDLKFDMTISLENGNVFEGFVTQLTIAEPSTFRLSVDDQPVHEWVFEGTTPQVFGVTGGPFSKLTIEADTFLYRLDNTRYLQTEVIPTPTPATVMLFGIGTLLVFSNKLRLVSLWH